MKILVVGGGGREHAIIKKLKENPHVAEITCMPGNAGIARDARCVLGQAQDLKLFLRSGLRHLTDGAVGVAAGDRVRMYVCDDMIHLQLLG